MRSSALFIFVLFFSLQALGADQLSEVVAEGVTNAFSIRTEQLKLEEAHNSRATAWFSLLPTLTLAGGRQFQSQDTNNNGVIQPTTGWTNALSATADWAIWNNYQNVTNVRTALLGLDRERVNSQRQVQQYILSLLQAYLDYQIKLNSRQVTLALLEQARWVNEEAKVLVNAGAKTLIDTMDSEVQMINAQRSLIEIDNDIANTERSLKVLLNSEKYKDLPQIDILKMKPYYLDKFEATIAEVKKDWEQDVPAVNPDLRLAQIDLETNKAQLFQTQLGYLPQTSIKLTHAIVYDNLIQSTVASTNTPHQQLHTTTLALTFTWPIFDWFNTPRTIANAGKEYEVSNLNLRNTVLSTKATLKNNLEQYEVLRKSIDASNMILEKAEKYSQYSQEMYRLGRITILNMVQASSRLTDAKLSLADRLKSKYLLAAQILYSLGYDLTPPNVDTSWIN